MEYIVPSYSFDIKTLIETFLKEKTTSFAKFKEIWKNLGFTSIHSPAPQDSDYIQLLYQTSFGYFWVNKSIFSRISILYILYCLHDTQLIRPPVKIIISYAMWEEFCLFYKEICINQLTDAYHILWRMKEKEYFCFSALSPSINELTAEKPTMGDDISLLDDLINLNTLSGTVDFKGISKSSSNYEELKSKIPQESLGSVNPDLVADLQNSISSYQKKKFQETISQTISFRTPSTTKKSDKKRMNENEEKTRKKRKVSKSEEEELEEIEVEDAKVTNGKEEMEEQKEEEVVEEEEGVEEGAEDMPSF